jgi:hypothetical protein
MLEGLDGALSGCMPGKEPSRHPCRCNGKTMRGKTMILPHRVLQMGDGGPFGRAKTA